MLPSVKTLSAACASALLVACADMGQLGRPAAANPTGGVSAEDAYVLARQQHLASRWPAAIDNYKAALRVDPRHVKATNGLATLYAEQGQLARAIGMWRELTLESAGSAATAYIHSNLGYAYLLNGDFQLAIGSLERACVLDPFNPRAWRHLGNALVKAGDDERAQRMFLQADTLEKHDVRKDYALTGAVPPVSGTADIDGVLASIAASVASAKETADAAAAPADWPRTEIHQTGSAMFELRRNVVPARQSRSVSAPTDRPPRPLVPAQARETAPVSGSAAANEPAVAHAQAAAPEAALAPELALHQAPPLLATKPDDQVIAPPLRLEIRNGNGVSGMARGLSGALGDHETQVVRLSNQKGFRVARTRVEYQPGFAEAARWLAERFGGEAVEGAIQSQVDLRLVLGRDVARSKSEARRVIRAALARAARTG